MAAVLTEKAMMDARAAHAAARFEASGAWMPSGARTAKAWVRFSCHLSSPEADRHLSRGRALVHLPLIDAAFSAGAITGDHVDLLVRLDKGATKDALHRQEALLLKLALLFHFDQWKSLVNGWKQIHDPDGTTDEAEEQRNRRDVWLVETINGTWMGGMNLDPVAGTIIAHELDRLEHLLFEADRAEATERLKRDPLDHELVRTPAQRRADALLMMALRSKATPKDVQKPEPAVHIHVGWEDLERSLSGLEGGPVVPVSQLLPWMAGADVIRVTHHEGGPLNLSHAVRIHEVALECFEQMLAAARDRKECNPEDRNFSGATRRAIEIRDGQCCHPFCDRPAEDCQVDHILPWSQGGETTQDNGRLLCPWHNRWCYQHEQRFGAARAGSTDEPDPPDPPHEPDDPDDPDDPDEPDERNDQDPEAPPPRRE